MKTRIPKIIHYCWFGRGKMPSLALKCIESWRKYLPDYKLFLWNEDNFDVNSYKYTREAYVSRKFAFVTDVVRLKALIEHGGIYMDTDVEVVKSFDELLNLPAFSGFESYNKVPTGIMASEKGGLWAKNQLDYYNNKAFILEDGSLDQKTNTLIISERMEKGGFKVDNTYQIFDEMHFFPYDYFCPKKWGKVNLTKNTYCIHHYAGSWNSRPKRIKRWFFENIIGGKATEKLVILKRKVLVFLGIRKKESLFQ